MAEKLDCMSLRRLLNSKDSSPEKYIAAGRELAENGSLSDAVDFLAKAGNEEDLEKIMETAIEEGDFFLYGRIVKALGRKAGEFELQRILDNADKLGKSSFAAQAGNALESMRGD